MPVGMSACEFRPFIDIVVGTVREQKNDIARVSFVFVCAGLSVILCLFECVHVWSCACECMHVCVRCWCA